MTEPRPDLNVVLGKLRAIYRRLAEVYDPNYGPGDRVQAALDLITTNSLPFLIDYLESGDRR